MMIDQRRTPRSLRHVAADTGRELRGAFRRLARSPGFAAAAILTLALGIGVSAAVLTLVYGILLRPLPYPDADRIVVIEHELPGFEMTGERTAKFGGHYALLAHYLERSGAFEEIGGFVGFDAAVAEPGNPQFLRMASATAGFFRTLGVQPAAGRLLEDDDPAPDANARGASLLAHSLWSEQYGRDPAVVGRSLKAEGFDNEIIGVLPARMDFPPERVSLWASLPVSRLHEQPEWHLTLMVARLAPGVTPEQARDELNRLIPELPDLFAGAQIRRIVMEGKLRAKVTRLHPWVVGDVAQSLWLLLAAVGVVLAIACVNVGNLILIRTETRRRELAVRTAIGATTAHLVRYFSADSLALVSLAAAAGGVLAVAGVDALRAGPASLPRLETVAAGWRVAAFTTGPALICLILFALVPWLASRRAAEDDLRGGYRATAGRALVRVRHALVAFQFAMAVVLLVAGGLIVRSFVALNNVDLGFEHRGVLTFRVIFPYEEIRAAGPGGIGPGTRFYDGLAERLSALPGVEAVGYGSCVPLSDRCSVGGLSLRRENRPDMDGALPATLVLQVAPGYLEALSVPLLRGRGFEPRDHEQRTHAVLISAEMARRFFPDGNPIGRRLVQDGTTWTPFTVVGVVGDVRHETPRKALMPVVYVPTVGDFAQFEPWAVSFVVRAGGSPLTLVDAVRREVQALRPDIPLAHVEALSSVVSRSTARLQFALWLLAVSGATAVALSAVGAYGTMAYLVTLRRNEFGIRLALGAEGRQLRAMVLQQGLITAISGLAVGAGAAILLSQLLRSLLFGVEPYDPATYLVALSGLLVTSAVAVHVPSRRAARLDPAEILRAE